MSIWDIARHLAGYMNRKLYSMYPDPRSAQLRWLCEECSPVRSWDKDQLDILEREIISVHGDLAACWPLTCESPTCSSHAVRYGRHKVWYTRLPIPDCVPAPIVMRLLETWMDHVHDGAWPEFRYTLCNWLVRVMRVSGLTVSRGQYLLEGMRVVLSDDPSKAENYPELREVFNRVIPVMSTELVGYKVDDLFPEGDLNDYLSAFRYWPVIGSRDTKGDPDIYKKLESFRYCYGRRPDTDKYVIQALAYNSSPRMAGLYKQFSRAMRKEREFSASRLPS